MSLIQFEKSAGTWLESNLGLDPAIQSKLFATSAVILIVWLIYVLSIRLVSNRISNHTLVYRWRKTIGYVSGVIAFVLVARLWFPGMQALTTFLGLFSAGLAIAFKDILTDIGGWIFIIYKRPYVVSDRVQIGQHVGDVIDIDMFHTTLLEIGGERVYAEQSTGRIIHIPNNQVFNTSIANYTEGFKYIWHEIPIVITFESDRKKAKEILETIVKNQASDVSEEAFRAVSRAARRYMIKASNLGPKVYTSIHDMGVQYTLRYTCTPYTRRDSIETISEAILDEFDKYPNIDFAYPTSRIFRNEIEGKMVQGLNLEN